MTQRERTSLPCAQPQLNTGRQRGMADQCGKALQWVLSQSGYLGLSSVPSSQEWSSVMYKLPIATIGCWECLDDQTKNRYDSLHCPGERYIHRGQAWQTSRQLRGFNMAKVIEKSWQPQTTSTKRWKKRKTPSQPRSRGKVRKIYKKVKRPLHVCSRKKYSPKVITTSRRQKRARRANKFETIPQTGPKAARPGPVAPAESNHSEIRPKQTTPAEQASETSDNLLYLESWLWRNDPTAQTGLDTNVEHGMQMVVIKISKV